MVGHLPLLKNGDGPIFDVQFDLLPVKLGQALRDIFKILISFVRSENLSNSQIVDYYIIFFIK